MRTQTLGTSPVAMPLFRGASRSNAAGVRRDTARWCLRRGIGGRFLKRDGGADDCIAFHVKAAVDRGATREEVLETLGMAIYMGAGPSAMYASHALGAYTQFAAAKTNDEAA